MPEQFELEDLAGVLAVIRTMTDDAVDRDQLIAELCIGLALIGELNRQACSQSSFPLKPAPTIRALLRRAARMPADPQRAAAFLASARGGLRSADGRDFATKPALEYLNAATTLMLSALVYGITGCGQRPPQGDELKLLALRAASDVEH